MDDGERPARHMRLLGQQRAQRSAQRAGLHAAAHVVQQGEARRDSSDDMATRNGNRIGARGRSDHADWEWVRHGMSTWRNNVGADVVEYGKVWGPALIFNFSVCPAHLRVPFIAGVSFFWTMVLSIMRGKTAP